MAEREPSWTIPGARGVNTEKERKEYDLPYSPASYCAQYGISLEDAEEMVDRSQYHGQVKRQITKMFASDPELARKALSGLDD